MICPKCKKDKPEVGHYSRDYTSFCSDCFAEGFVNSLGRKKKKIVVSSPQTKEEV